MHIAEICMQCVKFYSCLFIFSFSLSFVGFQSLEQDCPCLSMYLTSLRILDPGASVPLNDFLPSGSASQYSSPVSFALRMYFAVAFLNSWHHSFAHCSAPESSASRFSRCCHLNWIACFSCF